jgi:hypothetical protein
MNSLSFAGNSPGRAASGAPPCQGGHSGELPGLRPGRQSAPRPQHPDQAVIIERAGLGVRVVSEPRQRHPGGQ